MKPNALQYSLFDEEEPASSELEPPIELYRRLARELGGECLSTGYKGSKDALRFRCREGHEWDARPADIKNKPTKEGRGTWCPFCSKRRVEGVADFQKIAAEHGGECLSTEYKNKHTRLRFRCARGHEWEARAEGIKSGNWCRRCAAQTKADEKRLTITEFKLIAASRNGECLSTSYKDKNSRLKFRCADGHEWEALPSNIKGDDGTWCPECAITRRKLTLAEIQAAAKANGGECLSKSYANSNAKLRFRCSDGHEWDAAAGSVRQGSWCPSCTRKTIADVRAASSLANFHEIASRYGGACLSTYYDYDNSAPVLRFRCANGHEWENSAAGTKARDKKGLFCSYCNGTRHEDIFGFVQEFARSRGGECITKEYQCTKDKLRFRCSEGHEWEVRPHTIKKGWGWCRVCFDNAKFEIVRQIAINKGGACLSESYNGHDSSLQFRCVDGHEWQSTSNNITSGYWCPQCTNKTEGLVRQFMECVFQTKFPGKSPDWLQTPGRPRCILDGYNEELRMAFEYHGEQHFEHIEHFHGRGDRTLEAQQERDEYVRATCAAKGVLLIEVITLPYGYSKELFVEHVRRSVEECTGSAITDQAIERFYSLPFQSSKIRQLAEIAVSNGGECLSVKYIGSASPLQWKCANGHQWEAAASAIRQGQWCPFCAGIRLLDPLGEITRIAQERGGRCLSTEYRGGHTKHLFECAQGHRFEMEPNSMKSQNAWCEKCSYEKRGKARRLSITEIREIASQKGGLLLSEDYPLGSKKLRFRCALGHEWEALPAMVKHQTWCPRCASVLRGKKSAEARFGAQLAQDSESSNQPQKKDLQ